MAFAVRHEPQWFRFDPLLRHWLVEFLLVLSVSARTQWALFLSVTFFVGTLLIGEHMLSNVELQGIMQPFEEVVSQRFANHYEKAAFVALFTFLGLAIKFYRNDRIKLFPDFT